ncbi:pilus assembly protein TadG-related protein [Zavarzinia compransoris]|uniref:Putative Flp pilus-assembly TadG-like N-terminal domain-containing protein n=1 Tax=Zavarzinia compransoris TaxID=1264899 RepID=A0A317EAN8_9PROT|nr:pilus assembly protein TadG-related protein [Zavarzinia compransoris]PWR22363.1 hypothetical protein DKG75_10460 [Zavarzinia compransoris]TDP46869.1 putative membrane protein [Zavarzinia compransoris]
MQDESTRANAEVRRERGERGASAIIFAIALPLLIMMIAFVVDFGYAYYSRQRLQDSLDLAALAAVRELDGASSQRERAQAAAINVLSRNGLSADSLGSIQYGRYDRTRAVQSRFVPESLGSGDAPTAVQLKGRADSPRFFSRILARNDLNVAARSTAINSGTYATVRIGSGLAGLNEGLLNGILGLVLGSSVNLTALDYKGLLGANIDLLGLLDAYAVKVGLNVGDYNQLLGTDVSVLGVLGVAADVAQNAASGMQEAVDLGIGLGDAFPGLSKLPLAQLRDVNVKLGDLLGVALGTAEAGLAVPVNLFDLVTAGIFAASTAANETGPHALGVSLGTFLGASLDVSVVEPPQPPSGMRLITENDIRTGNNLLRTAQIRLLLQVNLEGPLGSAISGVNGLLGLLQLVGVQIQLLPGTKNLSVGINVAPAQAVVTELGCSPPNAADRYVAMNIDTGLLTAHIGQIDRAAFLSNSAPATASPLSVLSLSLLWGALPLLDVGLGVNLPVVGPTAQRDVHARESTDGDAFPDLAAVFDQPGAPADAQAFPSTVRVGTVQIISTLGANLKQALGLQLGGFLGTYVLAPLIDLVTFIVGDVLIAGILGPLLDAIVDLLLDTLGIRVGVADVAVIDLECGNAKLVP